jgi:hypothetical protein
MVSASIYHGILGFGPASRSSVSLPVMPKVQVEVAPAGPLVEVHIAAPVPDGVIPVAI